MARITCRSDRPLDLEASLARHLRCGEAVNRTAHLLLEALAP